MYTTIRNQVPYSPESSVAIGEAAGQQRQAYNAAVQETLAHPNVSKFDLQRQLTRWRQDYPTKWRSNLRIQRPGLEAGREAVRRSDQASRRTLAECDKELKLRQQQTPASSRNRPKHPVRPGRDLSPSRLYKSRKAPLTVTVYDKNAIRLTSPRTLVAAGLHLTLADPVPPDTDIRTVTITERDSSRRRGRNRPLASRSYRIILIVQIPDTPDKVPWHSLLGLDMGVINTLTRSDHRPAHQPDTSIPDRVRAIRLRQKRLKYKGRQWRKLQAKCRTLLRRHTKRLDNWEHHLAKDLAERHSLIAVEDLNLSNMRRSAKGTPEHPGSRVRQKTGLNRSLAQARTGELLAKIERHCEKTGTWFSRVPPRYTSTTCPLCGCRTVENRKSQAEFHCQRCGLEAHADAVAATNCRLLAVRALTLMLLLWAHSPDRQAETIRRRQGLPPLDGSLSLLAGRPGRITLGPSHGRDPASQDAAPAHAA